MRCVEQVDLYALGPMLVQLFLKGGGLLFLPMVYGTLSTISVLVCVLRTVATQLGQNDVVN